MLSTMNPGIPDVFSDCLQEGFHPALQMLSDIAGRVAQPARSPGQIQSGST